MKTPTQAIVCLGKWKPLEIYNKNMRVLYIFLIYSKVTTNLISLGDSHIEMEAAMNLGKFFEYALLKTIKFRESPKPDELIK
jgi:hypothetical protein